MVKTPLSRKELGRFGESLAAEMLASRGYSIAERNWRCPMGEVDLIARDGETWVFVEVKLRRSTAFGMPEEAITARKQAKLITIAATYIDSLQLLEEPSWRIDVIAIQMRPDGIIERLEHYQDAVRADG